jgi:hypothetical protein
VVVAVTACVHGQKRLQASVLDLPCCCVEFVLVLDRHQYRYVASSAHPNIEIISLVKNPKQMPVRPPVPRVIFDWLAGDC